MQISAIHFSDLVRFISSSWTVASSGEFHERPYRAAWRLDTLIADSWHGN